MRRAIFCGTLCATFTLAGRARAGYIDVDTTIDASSPHLHQSFTHVGLFSAGPTVTLVEGANMQFPITAFNASRIIVTGGSASIETQDQATATVTGGFTALDARENSTVTRAGGLGGGLQVGDTATANMSGGVASGIIAFGQGTLNVTGGQVNNGISLIHSAVATISNITVGSPAGGPFTAGTFQAGNSSTGTVSNTTIGIDLNAFDSSKLELNTVAIGRDLVARNSLGALGITGGSIGRDLISHTVPFTGSGVSIGRNLLVNDFSGMMKATLGTSTIGGSVTLTSGILDLSASTVAVDVVCNGGSLIDMAGGSVGGGVLHTGFGISTFTGTDVTGSVTCSSFSPFSEFVFADGSVGGNVGVTNGIFVMTGTAVTGTVSPSGGTIQLTNNDIDGDVILTGTASANLTGNTIGGKLEAAGSDDTRFVTADGTVVNGDVVVSNAAVVALKNLTVGFDLTASDNGRVGFDGGTVNGAVNLTGSSVTEMTAGNFASDLTASSAAQFDMTGGAIIGDVTAQGTSIVNLTGGNVGGYVKAEGAGSTINLGSVGIAGDAAATAGTLNLNSAFVGGRLLAWETGRVNMTGGVVLEAIGAAQTGHLEMTGGIAQSEAIGVHSGTIRLAGGNVLGDAEALESSAITLDGATVDGKLIVRDQATFVMNAGGATAGVEATGSGKFYHRGGALSGGATATDTAEIHIERFLHGNLNAFDDAKVFVPVDAGVNGDVVIAEGARATIDGEIFGNLIAEDLFVLGADHRFEATVTGKLRNVNAAGLGDINILAGASVSGSITAESFVSVDVEGATVEGNVFATSGSVTVRSNGIVRGDADVGYLLQLSSGGTVAGDVLVHDRVNALGTFSGSCFVGIVLPSQISPGAVGGSVTAREHGEVKLRAGTIGKDLVARDDSTVTITGGVVGGSVYGYESGQITMSGGTVLGTLEGFGDTEITFTGGQVLGGAAQSEFASILAGATAGSPGLIAHDNATLHIHGFDLLATPLDPNYLGGFTLYQLGGTFGDGSPLDGIYFSIQNGGGAGFALLPPIPEPSGVTLAALAIGGGMLTRLRRAA